MVGVEVEDTMLHHLLHFLMEEVLYLEVVVEDVEHVLHLLMLQ
jgi:hypothetical protein